jgi:hypothetical protein
MTKREENISCKNCNKEGHDDDHYWQLHLYKRPKWFKERKGRKTIASKTQTKDLGYD